jgi:serine protease
VAAGVVVASVSVGVPVAWADQVRDGEYWLSQLSVPQAWQVTKGAGVTVGVIDTGADAKDPDLAGALLPGKAFPDLGIGTRDTDGHGTEMAKLIAGRGHNGTDGTLGVAPEARILPVVARSDDTIVDAIKWVTDQGVKVINISQVTGGGSDLDDALGYAQAHDVVVVAGAGNVGQGDTRVGAPANRAGVIAVSAVDKTGKFRPDVSVQGPEVGLAAPGVDITVSRVGSVSSGSGTSDSTALVSGVVALVRARYPNLNAASVINRLVKTAKQPGGSGRNPQYGFGVVDPVGALTAEVPAVDKNPLGSLVPGQDGSTTSPTTTAQAAPVSSGSSSLWVILLGVGAVLVIGVIVLVIVLATRKPRPPVGYGPQGPGQWGPGPR